MKIRPVLKQQSAISVALALGSTLLPGCDQKLGGDVPVTPKMQEQWQKEQQKQEPQVQQSQATILPTDDDSQQLGGEPAEQ